LVEFINPSNGLMLLQTESDFQNKVEIPSFLKAVQDVSTDSSFQSYHIANKI